MARMKPTITLERNHVAASKQFTNRTGFIEAFNTAIKEIQEDDTKVLTYYGIGKTRLRKELQSQIEKTNQDMQFPN